MTHHHDQHSHEADPVGGRHVPLHGVIHQPVTDHQPEHQAGDVGAAAGYLPAVVQHPGQQTSYGAPTVVVAYPPATPRAGLGSVGSRLLIGAGIGAGAVLAVTLVGSLLLATLQALAMTALAIGGMALALAVTAAVLGRTLHR